MTAILAALIGSGGAPAAVQYLAIATKIVELGIDTTARLQALETDVTTIVNEGRAPTDEEWAALTARSDAAHDRIQKAAETAID